MVTVTRVWYARINKPSDRVILHLMDITSLGGDHPKKLVNPEEVVSFIAAHPEIEAVNVYDSRFPRRPVPVADFGEKMVAKLFK